MYVLIAYDAVDGRTEIFRKLLSRYLERRQNSVFSGHLPMSKLVDLRRRIGEIAVPEDNFLELIAPNRHNVELAVLSKSAGNGALVRLVDDDHKSDTRIL